MVIAREDHTRPVPRPVCFSVCQSVFQSVSLFFFAFFSATRSVSSNFFASLRIPSSFSVRFWRPRRPNQTAPVSNHAACILLDIRCGRGDGLDAVRRGVGEQSIELEQAAIEEQQARRGVRRVLWDRPGLYLRTRVHDKPVGAAHGRSGEGYHAQHVCDGMRRVSGGFLHRGVPAGGVHEHAPGPRVERSMHHAMQHRVSAGEGCVVFGTMNHL